MIHLIDLRRPLIKTDNRRKTALLAHFVITRNPMVSVSQKMKDLMFYVCQFIDVCLYFSSTHLPRWIFVLTRSWPEPGADSLLQKSCLGKREGIKYNFFLLLEQRQKGTQD